MKNPPPYFPQSQLSPPDPNPYKKFKAIVVLVILGVLLLLGGLVAGAFYLVRWLSA